MVLQETLREFCERWNLGRGELIPEQPVFERNFQI